MDAMARAYLACALWTATDENGEDMDHQYDVSDFSPLAVTEAQGVCADFAESAGDDLSGLDDEQTGHDLWLTRNRHGTGFWDRGLGDVGQRLTDLARPYGSSDVYVGEDGKLYLT